MVNISFWFEWIVFATTLRAQLQLVSHVTNIDLNSQQVKYSTMSQILLLIILIRSCCIWSFEKKQWLLKWCLIIDQNMNVKWRWHQQIASITPPWHFLVRLSQAVKIWLASSQYIKKVVSEIRIQCYFVSITILS